MSIEHPILFWSLYPILLAFGTIAGSSYVRRKARGKLVYQWGGRIVVGEEKEGLPNEVAIALKETGVPYISLCEIVIWNASGKSIRYADIVGANPICVFTPDRSRILRIVQRSATGEARSFALTPDPEHQNLAFCSFDSLEPGDGVRFQILVTGLHYFCGLKRSVGERSERILNWGKVPLGDAPSEPDSWWARNWPNANVALGFALIALAAVEVLARLATHHRNPNSLIFSDEVRNSLLNQVLLGLLLLCGAWAKDRRSIGRFPRILAKS